MKRVIGTLFAVVLILGLLAFVDQKLDPASADDTDGRDPAVIIDVNGTMIKASLYDNRAARSFMKLLPYSVTVSRAADDLCGSVPELLDVDPSEDSNTWKIGEIGWFDGWFTILCDNEDGMRKRTRTLIGKIRDEDIAFLRSIAGTVTLKISLEDTEREANGSETGETKVGHFDLENKRVMLNSGHLMPINGIGTYSLLDEKCVASVKEALRVGVRLIDTAHMYRNEEEVGRAIREAMEEYGIKREDIFVITKLYPGEQFADPESAIEQALDKLNVGYIDMMLLHHPGTNDVKGHIWPWNVTLHPARSVRLACRTGISRSLKASSLRSISSLRWYRMRSILIIRNQTLWTISTASISPYRPGIRWAAEAIRQCFWAIRRSKILLRHTAYLLHR